MGQGREQLQGPKGSQRHAEGKGRLPQGGLWETHAGLHLVQESSGPGGTHLAKFLSKRTWKMVERRKGGRRW